MKLPNKNELRRRVNIAKKTGAFVPIHIPRIRTNEDLIVAAIRRGDKWLYIRTVHGIHDMTISRLKKKHKI